MPELHIEPLGGLCNRLRAIHSAYACAKFHHIPLSVHWRDTYELACRPERLFHNFPARLDYSQDCSLFVPKVYLLLSKLRDALLRRRYDIFFGQSAITKQLLSGETFFGEYFPPTNVYIRTYSIFFADDSTDFSEWFAPAEHIAQSVKSFIETHFHQREVVGVHIRRTDHKESIERSKSSVFIRIIEQKLHQNPSLRFFLATDSEEEEKYLLQRFGESIIVRPKERSRTKTSGVEDALCDVLLLAATKEIIGSYRSSFSETAAAIGKIPLLLAAE